MDTSPKAGKEMTWADVCPEQVGGRVADHLRAIYPRHAEKLIAEDFKVHEATAKGWLSGNMPANKHLTKMIARWGKNFLDFVYAPVIGDPDIDIRLDRVVADIAALQAELRRMRHAEGHRRAAGAVAPVARGDEHSSSGLPRGEGGFLERRRRARRTGDRLPKVG